MTICEAMKQVLAGEPEMLENPEAFLAAVADTAPELARERRLLRMLIECGGFDRLIHAGDLSKDQRAGLKKQIARTLNTRYSIDRNYAEELCGDILHAAFPDEETKKPKSVPTEKNVTKEPVEHSSASKKDSDNSAKNRSLGKRVGLRILILAIGIGLGVFLSGRYPDGISFGSSASTKNGGSNTILQGANTEFLGTQNEQDGASFGSLLKLQKGEFYTFGRYEQDNDLTNGKEPIEWLVLDVRDDKALLISRYGLNAKPYNAIYTDVTWETCTLRKWLNVDFLYTAFTAEEQKRIIKTMVDNRNSQGNSNWSTSGGNNTEDRIYLLSYQEAKQYFSSDMDRQCRPTAFAVTQNVWINSGNGCCWWWLRSPGDGQNDSAFVNTAGSLGFNSIVNYGILAARPTFWINLAS